MYNQSGSAGTLHTLGRSNLCRSEGIYRSLSSAVNIGIQLQAGWNCMRIFRCLALSLLLVAISTQVVRDGKYCLLDLGYRLLAG